jgi:quercetin dioxygenase-like cupin family protein
MKTLTTAIIIGFILSFSTISYGQDWSKLDAKTVKKLVDTTLLRASEITIMPGEKGEVHTHAAHFFYALTDGKLIVHYTDGTNETYDLHIGDYGYSDPERPHWTENAGTMPVKFLIVELKEHPYKSVKKK